MWSALSVTPVEDSRIKSLAPKKMKIAVWHNLPSGGGKRALYDQVRGLVSRGHHVEVWCPQTANADYLPLNTLVREHVVDIGFTSLGSLSRLNPVRWNPASRLRAMDRHCRRCAEQINSGSFDLLFATACMFFRTTSIGRLTKIPKVIYLPEPCRSLYEALPELPWPALNWTMKDCLNPAFCRSALIRRVKLHAIRVQAREERRNAMAFDDILVNSLFSRESVLRAYGLDSRVCYLGVDTDRFVDHGRKRESIAVSIGAVSIEKNVEFILTALGEVPEPVRPTLVWIANEVVPEYLEKANLLAKRMRVRFDLKHRLPDSEVVEILNRARVMLYAPRLEPFGYAPLEANACGTPVVAVAEGGVRETVQDGINGMLVEHDPKKMASAIEQIFANDELFDRLSRQGRCLVQTKWALSTSADRLEFRLRETLARVRASGLPDSSAMQRNALDRDKERELVLR